ncbi:hypothetical protein J1N35_008583 [Gossypium stocksii]|uniref:Uncharacterized protein n=1 Tax=Gossypium stocksii TaxID=47602 RepID=A0A9D3WAL5_9ROSI|nr:hypothetical protein J1N35_008583 [Gossypium stocksii]
MLGGTIFVFNLFFFFNNQIHQNCDDSHEEHFQQVKSQIFSNLKVSEEISKTTFRQSLSSKLDVVPVMTTGTTSLEEQMMPLAKVVESIATSIKGTKDKAAFMMTQIERLNGSNQTLANETQHQTLQKVTETKTDEKGI